MVLVSFVFGFNCRESCVSGRYFLATENNTHSHTHTRPHAHINTHAHFALLFLSYYFFFWAAPTFSILSSFGWAPLSAFLSALCDFQSIWVGFNSCRKVNKVGHDTRGDRGASERGRKRGRHVDTVNSRGKRCSCAAQRQPHQTKFKLELTDTHLTDTDIHQLCDVLRRWPALLRSLLALALGPLCQVSRWETAPLLYSAGLLAPPPVLAPIRAGRPDGGEGPLAALFAVVALCSPHQVPAFSLRLPTTSKIKTKTRANAKSKVNWWGSLSLQIFNGGCFRKPKQVILVLNY